MTIGLSDCDLVTAAEEQELVRHLVADWHWGEPVRRLFGAPSDAKYLAEVSRKEFGGHDGDIDLVCLSESQPDNTIIVEFKVAKLRRAHDANARPNKLDKLEHLIQQANARFDHGFSSIFACLLLLIDGNPNDTKSEIHGGMTPEQHETVRQKLGGFGLLSPTCDARSIEAQGFQRTGGLDHRIGFIRIDLVQLYGAAPLTDGQIRAEILRPASRQQQSAFITEWSKRKLWELR
ncbi:MAG: hypothetical protein NTW01_18810 [Gammaproteobacteria bacterium]|nr:hypothetical protein [Gammaproteobacteria bacterium]